MKNVRNFFFAAVLMVASYTSQAQQVAHINVRELIDAMPEFKSSSEQLKKMSDGFDKDLRNMVTEYQTKAQQYSNEAATAGDATNQARGQELQEAQNRIEQYEANARQELGKKQEELQLPIMDKAQKAIQKVARAKNYQFVLDSTMGSGVIVADGPNIMDDVKKELNIK